jgi:YidC/Oxa1 family membrane protein insertase
VERRNSILFITLAIVWLTWILLQMVFPPARRPAAPQAEGQQAAKQDVARGPDDKAEQGDKDSKPLAAAQEPGREPEATQPAPEIAAPAAPPVPRQWLTLGSADPASGYGALYIFDNRGAALQRVQLNTYKSVEDHSGYLGHLELSNTAGGARVNVVGPGTPAALARPAGNQPAGLAVGDVIQEIDGLQVESANWVQDYLATKTRPGQNATLTVIRPGADSPLTFTALLARRPVEVVEPEVQTFRLSSGLMHRTPPGPTSLLLTLDNLGGAPLKATEREINGLPSLYDSNWKVEQQGPDFVEFSFALNESALSRAGKKGALKIVKRYTAPRAEKPGATPFHLDLRIAIENTGQEQQTVAYRLDGPTGLPLEGWWYSTKLHPRMWHGAGARDIVYEQAGMGHRLLGGPEIVSHARTAEKEGKLQAIPILAGDQAALFDYVGVDTQFFASALQPQAGGDGPIRFRSALAMPVQDDLALFPKTRLRTVNLSFRLATSPAEIKPGAMLTHEYRVSFLPKDPSILARYDLEQLIEYGWTIFAAPAKLLRYVLNGLYGLTSIVGLPNYGIAIILLTVIVRTCMIPISLKQARAAAKMQELAPEIQKIKERHPDDPLKQHQAVQELYKKHDFNMFSGCLPVFIQLPIFIGLYRCLSVDIDLRDASLIPGLAWCSNLAGPDRLFYWKDWMPAFIADEADGWLGPFFNVLPLVTVALFLVQQKMFTPPATDDQTRMQQQMMTYMTVFMGVLFYKVPAGLCIYFITSSLWGICERKLLPKTQPKAAGAGGSGGTGGGGGGGSLFSGLARKPTGPNGSSKPLSPKRKQKR